jgi:hypothetical protein
VALVAAVNWPRPLTLAGPLSGDGPVAQSRTDGYNGSTYLFAAVGSHVVDFSEFAREF